MLASSMFRLRLRSLFSRKKVEQEPDEELRMRQLEQEIAAGSTREEARYAALRAIVAPAPCE